MKKKTTRMLAGAMLGTASMNAVAGDFSGVYAGGSTGLFTNVLVEESGSSFQFFFGVEEAFLTKLDLVSGAGGQSGNLYFGAEASLTLANNLEETILRDSMDHFELGSEDGWSLGLRAGSVLQESSLFYGKLAFGERTLELS